MMPRHITPLEKKYSKQFPQSEATRFYPESVAYQEAFDALLELALDRGTALTYEEIVSTYSDEAAFVRDLEHIAQCYGVPSAQILEGIS